MSLYRQRSCSYAAAPSVPRDPRPELLLLLSATLKRSHSHFVLSLTQHCSWCLLSVSIHINLFIGPALLFPLDFFVILAHVFCKMSPEFSQFLSSYKLAQYILLLCHNSTHPISTRRKMGIWKSLRNDCISEMKMQL